MTDLRADRRPLVLGPHDPGSRRSLVTPEGVDLGLGLATIGQRISAFIIDLLIMAAALTVLTIVIVGVALAVGVQDGGTAVIEGLGVLWLLGFFMIRNFYFILFEAGTRAATWGKRMTRLRIAARNGERLTTESVIARNLMREVEVFIPLAYLAHALTNEVGADPVLNWVGAGWVLLFLLFPLFNKDRLRVGDLLAGTWVVMIPKQHLSYDLSAREAPSADEQRFTREQLDAYGVYELQTLEQVLRDGSPDAMRLVADTIRSRIQDWGPGDPHDFLRAYYGAAKDRMEQGLLFGKRRADKFDR
jgi:uncharacterized RDD family membrane protein YckC